jgi:signal transduction histidine kinase
MPQSPRRGLFWQIYPILLGSVFLVAVLGAVAWHIFGGPMGSAGWMSLEGSWLTGLHMIGLLLIVAGAIGFAAYPVLARATRRLETLRRQVDAWGGGELSCRASIDGRDEIAAVAASFNYAADRIDLLLAAHKALLAHASHELRSPLARLSLAAEMFRSGDQTGAVAMRREIAELDALVEEILLASRLDLGADDQENEPVDCLALAAEEAARVGAVLREVAPDTPVFEVVGSPRLLRRLIRNLIENAYKHGRPPVEIALAHGGPSGEAIITVAVSDFGPGIEPELRDRVFEPFFRPRGSGEEEGSWGLGLSLVRQIAARHDGQASCETDANGGTVFVVELPARLRDVPVAAQQLNSALQS